MGDPGHKPPWQRDGDQTWRWLWAQGDRLCQDGAGILYSVLLEWKESALQGTALSLCVSPASNHGIQIVSLCLVRIQGVKLFFLCKLSLINPFHQLQIYLLNPIKNMNMQIQTFFNTHFQGLGVRLDYSIPVNSL